MDPKRLKTDQEAVTRRMADFNNQTGNVYETVATLAKRADQIGLELKQELNNKIEEFSGASDNIEEIFENREQIEIARHYERLPKPSLIAVQEYLDGATYYRNPHKDTREEL
ncbi:MAG TPA: DNA-directed RNA polymerase subunit omega [Bacteroidales bacterium]|nr:DNA-directed RNA polymerase subunit omega [Bacteroidales bacterium]HRZ49921.1 DNA-directed RNA polymerase subunit omega [Bacteroidales bacterium]